MDSDTRDGVPARVYVIAFVDATDHVLVQVRVEQRDWMDRLLTRAQLSPLTNGGSDRTWRDAMELARELTEDIVGSLQ